MIRAAIVLTLGALVVGLMGAAAVTIEAKQACATRWSRARAHYAMHEVIERRCQP
jgi:hypothetical protein